MQQKPLHKILFRYCPLCHDAGVPFYKNTFFQCLNCGGIFRPEEHLPHPGKEKARYEQHNNDVDDSAYRSFVSPIFDAVKEHCSRSGKGLDFGAGTGPVISRMLKEAGYSLEQYDPFFFNNPRVLQAAYDYIVCCEVMEHFHNPDDEFALLERLLKPGGRLFCMTDLYRDDIDFRHWQYKNDLTHVFIYRKKTVQWIRDNIGFSSAEIHKRLITFHKL
jgi:hypothetical protein